MGMREEEVGNEGGRGTEGRGRDVRAEIGKEG